MAHLPPLGVQDEPLDEDRAQRDGEGARDEAERHADTASRPRPAVGPPPAPAHARAASLFRRPHVRPPAA
ncbi:hypothetical protein GCM10009527_010460 [Actinomadura nitritigenes]